MKAKATVFNLFVVVSMVLTLTAAPILTKQAGAPAKSVAAIATLQPGGDAADPADTILKPPVKQPSARHAPGLFGPRIRGPFSNEMVADSFDGDLRSLPVVTFDTAAPARVMPAPLEMGDLKAGMRDAARPSDRAVQRSGGNNMPAPIADFAGLNASDNPFGVLPPDTVGDAGPQYYIQYVNLVFGVYDKATGAQVAGPLLLSSLFNTSQAPCNLGDDGDTIALYDSMADRWLLMEFALPNYPNGGPYYQCIAISKSGDPVTGGWWTYTFPVSTPDIDGDNMAMNDYPKLSVWPDAYYMTANMFPDLAGAVFVRVWALDRARMMAGRPIRSVFFDVYDTGNMLAGNLKGDTPPAGSPAFLMAAQNPDKLNFWQFHADFENPAQSTLTGPTQMTVNPFDSVCGGGACVPQSGTTVGLETLSPRLMHNLQYRRVGSTESLWANHTITESGKAAVRWYEVRLARDSGLITPTLYQQGTFNPLDGVWRWMGSIAADKDGNAAVGYSASSPSIYPQIRYAGRLVGDPLNFLSQGEVTMTVGGGAQLRADAPRWGDYSAMNVDPDGCTFWYTTEYYAVTSQQNWATRIGSFKYPSCTPLPAMGYITGTVYDRVTLQGIPYMPLAAVNMPLTRTFNASTDASGVFTMPVLPDTYLVGAGPLGPNYPIGSSWPLPVTVTTGSTQTVSIGLQPFPALSEASVTIADPLPSGNANGYPEPGESNIQLTGGISNTGLITATNVSAQLVALTPTVTIGNGLASYGDIAPDGLATNAIPFTFSINGGVPCGAVLPFQKVITSSERVFTINFSIKAEMPGGTCAYPVPKLNLVNASYTEPGGNGFIEPGDTSINVFAALQNVGITTATSVSSTLSAQTAGITLNTGASPYPNIAVSAAQMNTTPFNFAVESNYACGVPAGFKLNTHTARGDFSHEFSLPIGQGPLPANVVLDDVEHGAGGWITGTTYSGWSWQITPEDSHSGSYSWTDSPGGNYPAGGSTWLVSPVYNFGAFDAVTLKFWHRYATEPDYDYGFVEVSTDGGATWDSTPVAAFDGIQTTWTQATVDLAPLAHHANARFRFRLFSDPSVVYDGWYIDDISVTGLKRMCNPVSSLWNDRVYVNGELTTTNPATIKPGDTVQIVDRVYVTATNNVTFALTEHWTAAFNLTGFVSTAGSVVTTSSSLAWNANNVAFNTDHTLTETFTVLSGSAAGAITGSLTVENMLTAWPDRTQSFGLPNAVMAVSPGGLSSVQRADRVMTKTLTVRNTGDSLLVWNIFEDLPSSHGPMRPLNLTAPLAITTGFHEGFDNITTLAGKGWAMINRSSPPGTSGWFQGNLYFSAQAGASHSYIAADWNNASEVGTISNWLLTPEIVLKNGDKITFYTRTRTLAPHPDRLEVRMSQSGASTDVGTSATSVGVFTTMLLRINPDLVVGGYPETWTMFTVAVSGLPAAVNGRFAFRYFVTNGGPNGANSEYMGIDTFAYTPPSCSTSIDVPWLSVSPTSGTTSAGASSVVNVRFDSTGLALGMYTGLLCINSNDALKPIAPMPVVLRVRPVSEIYLPVVRKV